MTIFCDIDGTICTQEEDYNEAKPLMRKIAKLNNHYDDGNTVIYWTARGSGTGIDWSEVTAKQLDSWGVKRHGIQFGKPVYDLFYDDKAQIL
jgi:hypothetical protein